MLLLNFDSFPWQILQCLSIQGLTSSGGGSGTAGGDGGTGSSSGASRTIVKERWPWPFSCFFMDFYSGKNIFCLNFNTILCICSQV